MAARELWFPSKYEYKLFLATETPEQQVTPITVFGANSAPFHREEFPEALLQAETNKQLFCTTMFLPVDGPATSRNM
jgi:hypothetical protein